MAVIIISIILMSFLIWSYNLLNKNFNSNNNTAEPAATSSDLYSLKRIFMVVLLFVGCYAFISITADFSKERVEQKYNNRSSAADNKTEINDVLNSIEQQKSMLNEKGKAIRVIPAKDITTKFTDVAGLLEAKDEVQDIIKFLQDPVSFSRLGAKSPKGVLLYGEPGTGKTLLARAIAGESNVSFISVAGAEFDEEYVGVGAARVRQLFETARENAPCIIFIDEIDALAHKRHSHDPAWSAQTVNQLLAEMDGLDSSRNNGIVVIGASNRINAIDAAMLRPGRLDRHIKLDIPTLNEREQVLDVYLKKITISPKVTAKAIAKMTSGFSGAELANLVNEAAIVATKHNKSAVEINDFDVAKDRIILGSKREALKVTDKTKKVTAYHEAGHALVGHLLGGNHQPIYKVTITPRGPTLGHTSFEPSSDEHSLSLKQIEAIICTQLAGRLAEELIFGEQDITTGAENDLKNATQMAYNMVTRWGYSKRIGPIYHSKTNDFIPKEIIEQEVQAIIMRNHERTKKILLENRAKLDAIANGLIEHETLDAKQIKEILDSKKAALN